MEALQLTQCDAPSWVKGYKTSGLTANAYARSDSVTSLAAGGDGDSGGLTGGQKAGIAVGTVCGVVLIAGAVVAAVLMKRRNTKKKQLKREMDQVEKGSTGSRSTR